MRNVYTFVATAVFCIFCISLSAQSYWSDAQLPIRNDQTINPEEYRGIQIERSLLESILDQAPDEAEVSVRNSGTIISIPMPDGTTQSFRFVESSVMAPELQSRYPFIRSYLGQGIDDKTATIRFDLTQKGFHAMILRAGETVYIDPISLNTDEYYMSYTKSSFYATTTKVFNELPPVMPDDIDTNEYDEAIESDRPIKKRQQKDVRTMGMGAGARTPFGAQLRTYRLALACTGEYAQFHGGTTADALAAMNTSMTRVNGVYERDAAIRMIIVANNDQVIFLNGATDPYDNGNGGAMLNQNQTTCDANIGSANYDIGHVYSTGGGGIAQLQSPCGGSKARGVTGQGTPVGDPFDIDYVCHEMGHQFGGNHTQNNSCNRAGSAAFEPGSASTIMGYAGICPPNLQSNSDDHFHNHSINEMWNFVVNGNGGTCPVTTNTGNTPPTVDAGPGGWTIPISTPFELTAVGSDADGDEITYNWEEYDLGPATAGGDNNLTNPSGNQPIFRSWPSVTDPTRVFPRITDLVNNTTVIGEFLPNYTRSLTFRCTVRDNVAGAGGVNDDQVTFDVSDVGGPFVVTAPNTAVVYPGNTFQTVTWDVANTDLAPINCSNVDIYLSLDGGLTYPTLLLANTANDGSELVLIPAGESSTARIKVKASNNIFFDISNQNFTIGPAVGANDLDAGILSINEPGGDYCGDQITPEVVVSNFGNFDLTSFDLVYDVDGGSPTTFNWTGSLATGESTTITLPTMTIPGGAHVFNADVQNPNGGTDDNPTNNAGSSNFNTVSGATNATFTLLTDCWGEEVSWTLAADDGTVIQTVAGNTLADQTTYTYDFCLAADCYDLTINDSFGDGLSGIASGCAIDGIYDVTDEFGNVLVSMAVANYGSQVVENFCVPVGTPGCTDPTACNYDATATVHDGSCDFTCFGCTDPAACNFSAVATIDDGSCELPDGCTDASACNYDPSATCDDGSCILPDGCTNAAACNYDPAAVCDDGSCQLPDGCTDASACNYDPAAQCDDGSCILPDGCTNAAACNYDPAATCDDGSCILPDGCTDASACNYDPAAVCDDGSCVLPDGCTDASACNYDPAATCDDGSCILPDGCTDASACNYDPAATCDDGSCIAPTAWYADTDNDGFGDDADMVMACAQPVGYVADNTDCNDNNGDMYPGGPSTQEGIDNDCNGTVDPDEEVPPCAGDFNNDGQINVSDLLILLGDYGCSVNCMADMNGDGVVTQADGLSFFAVFGTACD
ncbi:reprolysin-like metallopeptidase [Sanyastnella coralliicola]|uniref:reprolysin-like metallopeptidase n=1 Tax=Sanyastnella coralliicola TaxID=3069118 RepID=UPI0027B92096|nr:zinc-dependent metalloprotease family protein [Longitalea sp. SCSIO 12813]